MFLLSHEASERTTILGLYSTEELAKEALYRARRSGFSERDGILAIVDMVVDKDEFNA